MADPPKPIRSKVTDRRDPPPRRVRRGHGPHLGFVMREMERELAEHTAEQTEE
jgi:hypothetical protein